MQALSRSVCDDKLTEVALRLDFRPTFAPFPLPTLTINQDQLVPTPNAQAYTPSLSVTVSRSDETRRRSSTSGTAPGVYQIEFLAKDAIGHEARAAQTVTVLALPPAFVVPSGVARTVELGTDLDVYLATIQLIEYPDVVLLNQTRIELVRGSQLGAQQRRLSMTGTSSHGLVAASLLFNFTIVDTTPPVGASN